MTVSFPFEPLPPLLIFSGGAVLWMTGDRHARPVQKKSLETFPGHKRDSMLRRARQSQITSHLAVWLTSQSVKALR
jgi:hypothetical protein